MTLDRDTRQLLDFLAARGDPPIWHGSVADARSRGSTPKTLGPRDHVDCSQDEVVLGRSGRRIPVRIHQPSEDAAGSLVYFPGGGWVLGDNDANDLLARRLALATGLTVYLVEYSKAPEHRFPAAVEDAEDLVAWVAQATPGLPLHVGGDSAGANLAAVATLGARDGGPPITSQILFYPPIDAGSETDSHDDPEANSALVTAELMAWFWHQYLSDPGQRLDPRVSPLRADSLRDLPPTLLVTAEHDILRDEGERYGRRLEEAGVHVTHRRFAGQMHGFLSFIDVLPASGLAIDAVGEWIATQQRSGQ